MKRISLLLADDHTLVRQGIRSLVTAFPFVETVIEAASGLSTLSVITEQKPSIALLDISLGDMSGLTVLQTLQPMSLPTRVIMLSMYNYPAYVRSSIAFGSWGYIVKDAAVEELETGLMTVMQGNKYISMQLSRTLSGAIAPNVRNTHHGNPLTERETEVLKLISLGRHTKQIGTILNISPKTVESHRANIMSKLTIFDIAGLVRYAIRNGLISSFE